MLEKGAKERLVACNHAGGEVSLVDQLGEEDLRQYFLYLVNEKKVARATATIALCGIKFFYEHTLHQH